MPLSQSDGASHARTQRRPTEPPKLKHTSDAHAASFAQVAPSAPSGLSHAPLVALHTSLPGHPVVVQLAHVPVAGLQVGDGALQSESEAHCKHKPEGTWQIGVALEH